MSAPRKKRELAGVPTYAANGLKLRRFSVGAIERLLAMEPPAVVVKRNKRTGRICSAQFMPLPRNSAAVDGKEPIRKTAHMGQHYAYPEPVDDAGHRAWRFADFLVPDDRNRPRGELERELQRIFRAVPLSCLK